MHKQFAWKQHQIWIDLLHHIRAKKWYKYNLEKIYVALIILQLFNKLNTREGEIILKSYHIYRNFNQ